MSRLMKICSMNIWLLLVPAVLSAQQVVINEVQYANKSTLLAANGDTPDWIELYNAGNATVQVSEYRISDSPDFSSAWVLPALTIEPYQFLVLFASGLDQRTGELHTDFKLAAMQDGLWLWDPQAKLLDSLAVQCVPADKSLGRTIDGTAASFRVLSPTPGASNNSARQFQLNFIADSLTISHPSGFYHEPVPLSMQSHHPSNCIYYTLNADEPDVDKLLYTSSIVLEDINGNENRFAQKVDVGHNPGDLIPKAVVLRAQVFSEGCPASTPVANTYFIHSDGLFDYDVPIVSLISDKDNLFDPDEGIYTTGNHNNVLQKGKKWERDVHLEVWDSAGQPIIHQDAGMRIHGRGSRTEPQKSFRLYAREAYGNGTFEYPFFSQKPQLSSFKTLLLRSKHDWTQTLFKDEMCQYLVDGMNIDYTAARPVVVFLNGEYWGIYSLREQLDEHYVASNLGIDPPALDVVSYSPQGIAYETGDSRAYESLMDFLKNEDPASSSFFAQAGKLIDTDAFIDYYCAELYLANTDFPNNNLELWRVHDDTSRWRYFFFDMDAAMIRVQYNHLSEYNNQIDDFQRFDEQFTYILRRMLQNDEFRNRFYARFNSHLETTFASGRVLAFIDRFQAQYEPLAAEHIYRWGAPADYRQWLDNIDVLRSFAMQRPLVVQEQLQANFGNLFDVFPNPSTGVFTLRFYHEFVDATVRIFDLQGRVILQSSGLDRDKQSTLALTAGPGAYILHVQIGSATYAQKILVVK